VPALRPRCTRAIGSAIGLAAAASATLGAPAGTDAVIGRAPFVDHRNPPSYRVLSESERAGADLGHAVFNTQWVLAGTPRAERRDGLGPLFNAASCDECHNEGAHGRGPIGDGPAPLALVIQLDRPAVGEGEPAGDPTYGHVLSPLAVPGVQPEGQGIIHFDAVKGHYPDGARWELRAPRYEIAGLRRGPLAPTTLIRPRLAPALFGIGLLDAVPSEEISKSVGTGRPAWRRRGTSRLIGRFGWQAVTVSVREQTTRAFAREMGITSTDVPVDDCTAVEADCLAQPNGGTPEVSPELLEAVLAFQKWLAVPESAVPATGAKSGSLFTQLGCAGCHRPLLNAILTDANGRGIPVGIAPYTDLRVHDLGPKLADRDATGRALASRWRTAPLWGLGYRIHNEHFPTFLHDGRARSTEEAILWHDGEALAARRAFEQLPARQRQALLAWLETL